MTKKIRTKRRRNEKKEKKRNSVIHVHVARLFKVTVLA